MYIVIYFLEEMIIRYIGKRGVREDFYLNNFKIIKIRLYN